MCIIQGTRVGIGHTTPRVQTSFLCICSWRNWGTIIGFPEGTIRWIIIKENLFKRLNLI